MVQNKKRLLFIISSVAALLLLPAIAMQFTDEVSWSLMDFVVAAFLLLGSGLLFDLILRKVKKRKHRIAIALSLFILLLLLWAELAVGLFGSPIAGSWLG